MSGDISLIWQGSGADISVSVGEPISLFQVGYSGAGDDLGGWEFTSPVSNDYERDGGFETALLISLFTDRYADASSTLPPEFIGDRRGWWGDSVPVVAGDQIGSRLWLLAREKVTQSTLDRAVQYAQEALQWLLDDKVCTAISVVADFIQANRAQKDILALNILVKRPQTDAVKYQFNLTWDAQEARSL